MTACVIEDDIPYPLQEGAILSMTVEGQRAGEEGQSVEATIDAKARTVTLFVNDSVDLSRLKIKSLKVTEGATLKADSAACADILRFPTRVSPLWTVSLPTRIRGWILPSRFLLR